MGFNALVVEFMVLIVPAMFTYESLLKINAISLKTLNIFYKQFISIILISKYS